MLKETTNQSDIADMWNDMIPPPDGQIVINRLGTVCMSYNTLKQLGYECTADILNKWLNEERRNAEEKE